MANAGSTETRVLRRLQWIFFSLGLVALVLFLFDPDIHKHPELVLLAGTGLMGSITLRGLASLFEPSADLE